MKNYEDTVFQVGKVVRCNLDIYPFSSLPWHEIAEGATAAAVQYLLLLLYYILPLLVVVEVVGSSGSNNAKDFSNVAVTHLGGK